MWSRATSINIVSTNIVGRGGAKPWHFCGSFACAFANNMAREKGRHVHEQIIQRGCKSNVFVGNCLIDMYAKCGSIEDVWRLFNMMPMHDVIAWSAMNLGHVNVDKGTRLWSYFSICNLKDCS
jgi:pentatricopeptide repeat protein